MSVWPTEARGGHCMPRAGVPGAQELPGVSPGSWLFGNSKERSVTC